MTGPRKALPRGTSGILGAAPLLYLTHPDTGQLLRRRWRVVVTKGPDTGKSADLTTWTALVGAAPAAALELTDDATSRYHAELDLFAEGIRVRDLGSTNGTFAHSDTRVKQAFLHDKHAFRVGETIIEVEARQERVFEPALPPTTVDTLAGLVAADAVTRRLFARIRRVAQVRSTVLLIGAKGTGKSAYARALHAESRRRNGPFVCVDLSESTPLEPAFEQARGGTLFLDNVESLARGRQAALLSCLENLPVGGRDLRVVAASTHALKKPLPIDPRLAARLSVVQMELPRLSQRSEDVVALARHFFAETGADPDLLGPQCLERLKAQDWPGQVTDLRRALRRLAAPAQADDESWMRTLRQTFLVELLGLHKGHVTQASAAVGMTQRAMFSALSSHGVDLDEL